MKNKEHSIALDIAGQIQNLKDNNLKIENEEEAARILNEVSYYRLVKAYGPNFKNKNGRYNDNASFEKIWRQYEFDNALRYILIPYIQRIEITLRCRISNYFCVKYGVLGYLDSSNFKDELAYNELNTKMLRCINQSKDSPIIKNFKMNYTDKQIPLYAAVEIFSFGTLAEFYNAMKTEDKNAIASMFSSHTKVDSYYLGSWLVSIAYVRNLCAHFNRLYKKSMVKAPKLYPKQDGDVDNKRLFSVLCCMRYLYAEFGEWSSFVYSLKDILDEYSDAVKPAGIGCIANWETKLLDQENNLFLQLKELL